MPSRLDVKDNTGGLPGHLLIKYGFKSFYEPVHQQGGNSRHQPDSRMNEKHRHQAGANVNRGSTNRVLENSVTVLQALLRIVPKSKTVYRDSSTRVEAPASSITRPSLPLSSHSWHITHGPVTPRHSC